MNDSFNNENDNDEKDIHLLASKNLSFVLVLNLLFNIVVIGGGLLTNSVAIVSDALHDLSDTLSILIAWILEKLSQRKSNEKFTYGYQRLSVFGALFNSTIVILASLTVVYEAFTRLFVAKSPDAGGMILIAILGIVFKGASLIRLHRGKTFNERAISIHMYGDVFQWIALLIISLLLYFVNLPILDPIASICVSLWVIYNLAKTFIASAKILLQASPSNVNIGDLKRDLLGVDGVESIEDFHIWSMDGIDNVLTCKFNLSVEKENIGDINSVKHDLNSVTKDYGISSTNFEFIF